MGTKWEMCGSRLSKRDLMGSKWGLGNVRGFKGFAGIQGNPRKSYGLLNGFKGIS